MHPGQSGTRRGNFAASCALRLVTCARLAGIGLAFNLALRHIRRAAVKRGKSGRSSGVEHNLAKVGVVSSNLIARSKFPNNNNEILLANILMRLPLLHW